MHVEGVQTRRVKTKLHNMGATQHGVRGVKAGLSGHAAGASGGKGKASRRIGTEANGVF